MKTLCKQAAGLSPCCSRRLQVLHQRFQSQCQWLKTTRLFPPVTGKEDLKESGCVSQRLMLKYGLMQGSVAGTFHLLPSGVRALEKLKWIIDRHMQNIGAQKFSATCLGSAELWKKSGRWDEMGSELLTVTDRMGKTSCLSPTHEEAITSIVASVKESISYKTLPIKLYQIGKKFRDEMRSKNGLLRCREFEMKDLYTFDKDEENGRETYHEVCAAYDQILKKLNVNYVKVAGDTGVMGGKLSHEFHILSDVGEDTLLFCDICKQAVNKECQKTDEISLSCDRPDCPKTSQQISGIEIAHAFLLGEKYSEVLQATYASSSSLRKPLFMGCFGIGTTRLLASVVEHLSKPTQMKWPRLIAPYQICIVPQKKGYKSDVTDSLAERLHEKLCSYPQLSWEVVLDDRTKLSIGRRLIKAKGFGYPYVVVVGKQSLEEPPKFELIDVYQEHTEYVTEDHLLDKLSNLEVVPV